MGIGDIAVSLWGECEQKAGMHFSGRGFVHFELIDPETGAAKPLVDGARGRARAHPPRQPLRRRSFASAPATMSRLWTGPCACGRTAPRVRCIGRTDDMLIVRGVNVFPSAVREVINEFAPAVSGVIMIRPRSAGRAAGAAAADRCRARTGSESRRPRGAHPRRVRDKLLVTTEIDARAPGSLPRSEYKSKLVEKV